MLAFFAFAPAIVAAPPLSQVEALKAAQGWTSSDANDDVIINGHRRDRGEVAASDKTGTRPSEVPMSIQTISREILNVQGATLLRQSLSNASGVNFGGQDSKGFYDHFMIRGLNAQIFEDGFSDGDQLGGISHSLNGVESIEILEGPGSALFGSGPPGGTIVILHYAPSSDFQYGAGLQMGSFGTTLARGDVTGPTGFSNLDYRVDATLAHANGFRRLSSRDYEVRPSLLFDVGGHHINLILDAREIHETPDSYGLIYFEGTPIKTVSIDAKYSSPFAKAHTQYVRPEFIDVWTISNFLTINNRFSYLHRTQDSLGNGDNSNTKVSNGEVISRQLRRQNDDENSLDYQLEPLWHFSTGPIGHSLVTGFEYQRSQLSTSRSTADLSNIPDAFAPIPPETSADDLIFLCDSKHSCDDDKLTASYYAIYAADQIDVTKKLKLRAGIRQDWFDTSLTPEITVPGRFGTDGKPLIAGVEDDRNSAPLSWNAGLLYKLTSWASPYAGISKSHLSNFNSENTQSGVGAPESALEHEAGVKFRTPGNRLSFNAAVFEISRNNVAAAVTLNGVETVVFDSQRTTGAEASLDAELTQHWSVTANFTAQNAIVTDDPQGIASVGHHPQGVPARMANLWTTYKFSVSGLSGFRIAAGVNCQSRSFSDLTNVNSIPPSTIMNASLGYDARRWGIEVNLHNLTDKRYFIAANGAGALVGQPLSAFATFYVND